MLAVALLPLFLVDIPTLYDYANHVAGLHVLLQHEADPALARNYAVEWRLQPNLASELLAIPLRSLFSAYQIGRLLLALALFGPLIGTFLLYRVLHGRFGYWPLAAALFLYSHILAIGALNYVIAMGLMLLSLALWLWLSPRLPWAALAAGMAAAFVLYVFHLFACACFILAILLHAVSRARQAPASETRHRLRPVLFAALPALVPAVLALAIEVQFSGGYTAYGGLRDKLVAVLSPTLFFGTAIDYVTFAVVYVGLVLSFTRRQLALLREMRPVLLGLVVAAALVPSYLGSIWAADWRLPPLIAFLLLASTRPRPGSPAIPRLVAGLVIVLLLGRVWSVGMQWQAFDADYAEFRAAARTLPLGARLLTVENGPEAPRPPGFIRYPYVHMSALAVVDRSAFVPTLFTFSGPLRPSERNLKLNAPSGGPLTPAELRQGADPAEESRLGELLSGAGTPYFWAAWPRHFDYVLWLHYGAGAIGLPAAHLAVEVEGSFFTLYRVINS